ncbi:hypothetical protein [Chitinilyticum litopenaei]|uniref:hypothetical protein n=1 Tax=Chitinilyticum litopenaei TaxID=1121276 RepID=UPI0003F9E732|nr:hypothetical protein [Chitinilyticum litopenaei]
MKFTDLPMLADLSFELLDSDRLKVSPRPNAEQAELIRTSKAEIIAALAAEAVLMHLAGDGVRLELWGIHRASIALLPGSRFPNAEQIKAISDHEAGILRLLEGG